MRLCVLRSCIKVCEHAEAVYLVCANVLAREMLGASLSRVNMRQEACCYFALFIKPFTNLTLTFSVVIFKLTRGQITMLFNVLNRYSSTVWAHYFSKLRQYFKSTVVPWYSDVSDADIMIIR